MTSIIPGVAGLQGLWRRSLISWPGRGSDTTTTVRWLQGPRAYIDLRQPTPLPDFSHVRSLEDLTLEDCAWLARQEGFAGHLGFDGVYFEWHREIDFQPRAARPDAGSLHWEGNVLVETGREGDYIEHWQRDPALPNTPANSVDLQADRGSPKRTLLRVGPHFMFARERTIHLEAGYRSLAEYVAAAPDVARARELIDCEISFGEARQDGLRITASTLPYRVGTLLEFE
jgi:allophanate hydrolase